MSNEQAELHLKRARVLLEEVQAQFEGLETHLEREASSSGDGSVVAGILASYAGGRRIAAARANLHSEIALAWAEIDKAEQLDPSAVYEDGDEMFNAAILRAAAYFVSGQLEAISGSAAKAKSDIESALRIWEAPGYHHFLGMLYEADFGPVAALHHYERCLELDPSGEYSVAALRGANRMRNYSQRFRGDWGTFGCLLVAFFPAAIAYYFIKRR